MPTATYAQYGDGRKAHKGGRILTATLLPARRAQNAEAGSRWSLRGDPRQILIDLALVLVALLDVWLKSQWIKALPPNPDFPAVEAYQEWFNWIAVAALLMRRRFPFVVLALTIPGFFTGWAQMAAMIALYTVARRYITGWQTVVAGVLVWSCRFMTWPPSEFTKMPISGHFHDAIYGFLVVGLPIAIALLAHARQELSNRITELAESRERERVLHAHAIRADERAKLAREMHDVVSHQVSLIAMQAGALRMAVADAEHKQVAGTIRTLSTRTLDELRQLVSVLRAPEDTHQPGVDELSELAADAGFEVSVQLKGAVQDLAAPVSGAVYRTVQEALTNIRKHAVGASATVLIDADEEDVLVEVRNTAAASPSSSLPSGGHGLVGLRERATLLGGEFSAGPTEEGGFLVSASFPKQRGVSG